MSKPKVARIRSIRNESAGRTILLGRCLRCGNGTIRTQHPVELFGEDWLEWELDSKTSPINDDNRPPRALNGRMMFRKEFLTRLPVRPQGVVDAVIELIG